MKIWLVIINPNAGNGRAIKKWNKVKVMLKEQNIPFVPLYIQNAGETISKTKEAIQKGFRRMLVLGGDGTLNEVVNAIHTTEKISPKEFIISMIPIGTGNDWSRTYKMPHRDIKKSIAIIKNEKIILQDIGVVEYFSGTEKKKRYFINNAGMGYDAVVVEKANRQKKRGISNNLSYFLNVFTMLLSYKCKKITVKIDDEEYHTDMFSMNVGICKYMGAGMMMLPYAIPDDGLFEFTMIRKIKRGKIIRNTSKLYNGNIVKLEETFTTLAETIEISSDEHILLEADGEILGHGPFKFNILKKCAYVVVP